MTAKKWVLTAVLVPDGRPLPGLRFTLDVDGEPAADLALTLRLTLRRPRR